MPRLAAALVWSAVAAAGVVAWRWLPRGFPVLHPRFIINDVAPAAVMVAAAFGLFCVARKREAGESRVGLAALLIAFCVAVLAFFGRAGIFAALVAAPSGLSFLVVARETVKRHPRRSALIAFIAASLGAGAAWSLGAPPPSTKPIGSLPEAGRPAEWVEANCGKLRLRIDPALRFEQASHSRFWSIFGREDARDALSAATLVTRIEGNALLIDAGRTLAEPIYAHLDSFARVEVWRAKQLRVRLAAGTPAIDVLPSDYPAGRPARFAAWSGEKLTAYEATSAEKGPFHPLAETPLRRGDPVVLELLDGDEPQCRVSLLDFTAQASTELSPTAGFGVPQNAIELLASEQAPVQWILFSLAATSVGRGWDTVGHAAGAYRNRMRIE